MCTGCGLLPKFTLLKSESDDPSDLVGQVDGQILMVVLDGRHTPLLLFLKQAKEADLKAEIPEQVAGWRSIRTIADALVVEPVTVKAYIRQIRTRLRVAADAVGLKHAPAVLESRQKKGGIRLGVELKIIER